MSSITDVASEIGLAVVLLAGVLIVGLGLTVVAQLGRIARWVRLTARADPMPDEPSLAFGDLTEQEH